MTLCRLSPIMFNLYYVDVTWSLVFLHNLFACGCGTNQLGMRLLNYIYVPALQLKKKKKKKKKKPDFVL